MDLIVLISTIILGSYLFIFESDSEYTGYLIALAPLSWFFFFLIRALKQKKESKIEIEGEKLSLFDENDKRIDPDEIVKKTRKF